MQGSVDDADSVDGVDSVDGGGDDMAGDDELAVLPRDADDTDGCFESLLQPEASATTITSSAPGTNRRAFVNAMSGMRDPR